MVPSDSMVLSYVNNALRDAITTDTLTACLRDAAFAARFREHLTAFFLEVPIPRIDAFATAHDIGHSDLLRVWRWLSAHGREQRPELDRWLVEMAS